MDYFSPSFFSQNYTTARDRFRNACESLRLSVDSVAHPLSGPEQESLSTDVVTLGNPEAPNQLLLCSGTHGVEGFCGSACQLQWLSGEAVKELPPTICITIIHAINPFGFVWLRRVNEDNIDLNRNFIDFRNPHPENPLYEKLLPAILPKSLHPDDLNSAKSIMRSFISEFGSDEMQKTLSQGQYRFPQGLYYGGAKASWSNQVFRKIVTQRFSQAERAIFIDFHTGLGPYGVGELITEYSPDSEEFKWTKSIFSEATSTVAGDSSSVKLNGTIDFAFHQSLPSNCQGAALALEFGTRESSEVFKALRNDNWLHLQSTSPTTPTPAHIDPIKRAANIKADLLDAFCPDEDNWKQLVLSRSEEVIDTAIKFLNRK